MYRSFCIERKQPFNWFRENSIFFIIIGSLCHFVCLYKFIFLFEVGLFVLLGCVVYLLYFGQYLSLCSEIFVKNLKIFFSILLFTSGNYIYQRFIFDLSWLIWIPRCISVALYSQLTIFFFLLYFALQFHYFPWLIQLLSPCRLSTLILWLIWMM